MDQNLERCIMEGQRLKSEGKSVEEILRFFRAEEASIIDSIKLLTRLDTSLGEAKRIVHFSNTWADFRAGSEILHAQAERAARQLEAKSAEEIPDDRTRKKQ